MYGYFGCEIKWKHQIAPIHQQSWKISKAQVPYFFFLPSVRSSFQQFVNNQMSDSFIFCHTFITFWHSYFSILMSFKWFLSFCIKIWKSQKCFQKLNTSSAYTVHCTTLAQASKHSKNHPRMPTFRFHQSQHAQQSSTFIPRTWTFGSLISKA